MLLVDLQDVGCRIYTFVTTLRYVLEAAAEHGKAVWVLDRPNPAGRPVEGLRLRAGWESFVGAGPLPMRHGLTLGELARWFVRTLALDVECEVVTMEGWKPAARTGLRLAARRAHVGQPEPERAESLDGALLRGHRDARRHDAVRRAAARRGRSSSSARPTSIRARCSRRWSRSRRSGCAAAACAPCWFEPTFHKHAGKLCAGLQIHVDDAAYDHDAFRPWRLVALAFKALRALRPDYELWRDFPYEYERGRLAIDVINGGELLREWVDDPAATARRPRRARAARRGGVARGAGSGVALSLNRRRPAA